MSLKAQYIKVMQRGEAAKKERGEATSEAARRRHDMRMHCPTREAARKVEEQQDNLRKVEEQQEKLRIGDSKLHFKQTIGCRYLKSLEARTNCASNSKGITLSVPHADRQGHRQSHHRSTDGEIEFLNSLKGQSMFHWATQIALLAAKHNQNEICSWLRCALVGPPLALYMLRLSPRGPLGPQGLQRNLFCSKRFFFDCCQPFGG